MDMTQLFHAIRMRVWNASDLNTLRNAPQSLEEALLHHRPPTNVPERFDFTNLNDEDRARAEKYLFIQCVQKCGYGDTRICDMSHDNLQHLSDCLRQYGYELEFVVDGTDALYRFHCVHDDDE